MFSGNTNKGPSGIPWFSRATVQADGKTMFAQLGLYTWDEKYYWGVDVEALASLAWRYVIAVYDVDLSYYGSVDRKRTRDVSDVVKEMLALVSRPLIEEGGDVDL